MSILAREFGYSVDINPLEGIPPYLTFISYPASRDCVTYPASRDCVTRDRFKLFENNLQALNKGRGKFLNFIFQMLFF